MLWYVKRIELPSDNLPASEKGRGVLGMIYLAEAPGLSNLSLSTRSKTRQNLNIWPRSLKREPERAPADMYIDWLGVDFDVVVFR